MPVLLVRRKNVSFVCIIVEDGDTVNYLNWEDLRRAIDYDIEQEKSFSYKGLSSDEMITHISRFV